MPITLDGEPFRVGFNASYLLCAVAAIAGDTLRIAFPDDLRACIIAAPDADDYGAVIMPQRP